MAKYNNAGSKVASNSDPYRIPDRESANGGFFGKLKSFFGSNPPKSPNKVKMSTLSELQSNEAREQDVDLSNISVASRNPNDTLADFFSSRGDKPLNDIEIEGVMSLIRKAHNGNIESRNTSMMNHSRSGIFGGNTSRLASGVSRNQSLLYNDSNNSTILRHGSSKVNIPTPKYVPPKSANTSVSQVDKSMLASIIKKRKMVNYNNLEKQNQKISSPLASYIEKRKRENRMKQQQRNNLSKLEEEGVAFEPAKKQNLSKTANTLLDILDSKTEVTPVQLPTKLDNRKKEEVSIAKVAVENENEDIVMGDEPVEKVAESPKIEDVKKVGEIIIEDDNDIIIIEDEEEEEEEQKEEQQKEEEHIEPVKPVKSFTFQSKEQLKPINKLPTAPVFTFEPKVIKTSEPTKPIETPLFPFKPMADLIPAIIKSAPVVEEPKSVEPVKIPEQPKFTFAPSNPTFTKVVEEPASSIKFSFSNGTKANIVGEPMEVEKEQEEKEIIEHFDFPDVSDTNIEVKKIESNDSEKDDDECVYKFPSVPAPNMDLLSKIDDKVVELYGDSFKF